MKQLSVKSSPVSGAGDSVSNHHSPFGKVRVPSSTHRRDVCMCVSRGSLYFQGLCVYFQGHGRADNGLAGK